MSAAPANGERGGGAWPSAVALAACVLAALALVGTVERLAAGRIEAARAARLGETLAEVLPAVPFDNDPASDAVTVRAPALGGGAPRLVYRARLGERDVGAVLSVVAEDGYSGPIELLVGVDAGGRIGAVRVVSHRETPGLGDRIERRHDDWITRFDGRALDADEPWNWHVVRGGASDGANGDVGRDADRDASFDALSGATITSRAVVDAVHRSLRWFASNRDRVFAR